MFRVLGFRVSGYTCIRGSRLFFLESGIEKFGFTSGLGLYGYRVQAELEFRIEPS